MTTLIHDLVPDKLWALVAPLLLVPPRPPYGGRHRTISDRACLAAIVYMARTSTPWRLLPARELGCGLPATSPDAVAQVGRVVSFESSDQLELDVVAVSVLEQFPAGAQENRNQVDLPLVELARLQQCLRGTCAVHHDGAIAGCDAGLGGAFDDVGDELRSTGWLVAVVDLMGQHEDRDSAVVVALPAFGKLECPSSGDDCTCRHELAEHLAIGPWALGPACHRAN